MIWRASFVCFVFGMALGSILSDNSKANEWHRWALDNGYAHFDSKTGALVLHTKKEIQP